VPKSPSAPAPQDAPQEATGAGKGRPTPSRAEQEAARKRPLVANTKEAKERAKADLAVQREKARAGMAAGEDRYLPQRDKGPQRRFVRDWIDAGFHIGEGILPFMVLVIVATFLPVPDVQYWAFILLWVYVLAVVVDMVITTFRLRKAARRKFGDRLERGLSWYGSMRTIQMRFMRLPKPQARRGQYPS
jgi:Flp pilus assembly protein TadB